MFALQGLDWRSWTVADRCSVVYLLRQRVLRAEGDRQGLMDLYRKAGDKDAEGALAREIMGQSPTIQTDF